MAQYDFGTIVATTKSGTALAADLNSWRTALHSMHKGSSAPAYLIAGMVWLDDTLNPIWIVKQYDGTNWIPLYALNTTTNLSWMIGNQERHSYPLAGGSANALTLTPVIPFTAYVDLDFFTFEAASNNSGAVTLNISALGTKAIRKMSAGADVALVTGDILDGGRYALNYDSAANAAAGAWILINPGTAGGSSSNVSEKLSYILATGTGNAIVLTPTTPLASYVDLDIMTFEAAASNSAAVTVNISGLGLKAIRKMEGAVDIALVTGDILDGLRYNLNYDSAANAAAGAWILTNPSNPTTLTGGNIGATGGFYSQTGVDLIIGTHLASSGTGSIKLRPKGLGSATDEMTIGNTGNVTINGTVTITG